MSVAPVDFSPMFVENSFVFFAGKKKTKPNEKVLLRWEDNVGCNRGHRRWNQGRQSVLMPSHDSKLFSDFLLLFYFFSAPPPLLLAKERPGPRDWVWSRGLKGKQAGRAPVNN